MCGRRGIEQNSMVMLQPGRLQRMVEGGNNRKTHQIFTSGPRGRGKREKRFPSGEIAEGDSDSSLLARKGEQSPLQGR